MEEKEIRALLEAVARGETPVGEAVLRLKMEPFEDLGFAKLDHHRGLRQGAAEVVYGAGKTPEQILAEQAASSPQAAAALQEFARGKREDLEKMFRDQKEQTADFVARYERLLKDALAANAQAAQGGKGGATQQIFR